MSEPAIALVVYDGDRRPDAMLRAVVRRLQRSGLAVAGLLQDGDRGEDGRCARLFVEDIATGRRAPLFQPRGTAARGCRLDLSGLAEAAAWLRHGIEARPDILFVNRFGRQEAEGRGLLDEIASAIISGIPLVLAIDHAALPRWRDFADDAGSILTGGEDELEAWCARMCASVAAGAAGAAGAGPNACQDQDRIFAASGPSQRECSTFPASSIGP